TTAGLLLLHLAVLRPGGVVFLGLPPPKHPAGIFRPDMNFFRKLKKTPEVTAAGVLPAEVKNSTPIWAPPGSEKTGRGDNGANLIILDEASRVEDELLGGITPMLATTNGSLIALTTPAGKRGWFYEQWISADDWTRVRVNAAQCPRISKEFLDEEMRRLGPT